ncbi:MAG: HEAT repeat domain-containing protein [Candidatus Thorarchaeota archaeon]
MTESVAALLISLDYGDYVSAFSFLDNMLASGQAEQLSKKLERVIELDGRFSQYQLKFRDLIAEYLGFGGIYFGLQIPSYSILEMVSGARSRVDAQALLVDIVLELVEKGDSQVNYSLIEIETLKKSPYIVLIPYVLSDRTNELKSCKVYYSVFTSGSSKNNRYCLSDLMTTHYGRKITNAFKFDLNYPILPEPYFVKLREILQSFGYDVESNLVEISVEDWPYFVTRKTRDLEQEFMSSTELWLVYQTYVAMIGLDSDDNNNIRDALKKIETSRTKYCSDALLSLVETGTADLQLQAIDLLVDSPDYSQIDSICNLIPQTTGAVRKSLIKAVSAIESAQYFIPKSPPQTPIREIPVPTPRDPEVVVNYLAALDQLSRSSSSDARIDAARALSTIQMAGVETHLRRLMFDEDPRIRLAVLEASQNLPKNQAVSIIRQGLQDVDRSVENKAVRLFEERWPDNYW